jgi:hypothetical protein
MASLLHAVIKIWNATPTPISGSIRPRTSPGVILMQLLPFADPEALQTFCRVRKPPLQDRLKTARKLPAGLDRQGILKEIGQFRVRIAALKDQAK